MRQMITGELATSVTDRRGEVDFVVTRDGIVAPCQATWEAPSPRHERALEDFYETFPQAAECT